MQESLSHYQPFDNFESASRAMLAYLHERLGFKLWMTTRTEGDDWIVLHTEDHGYGVDEGTVFRWADSFCSRMVAGRGPKIAPSAEKVPAYAAAPIGQQVPIGAYIGVPIAKEDGTLYGTLCAIDPEEQPETITEHLPLINLLAQLLATVLASDLNAAEQIRLAEQTRRAEQAVREQNWRIESILKGTNVGSWEWNVQTGETVFNERWAEIIGYTLEEISPISIDTWIKIAHPDDLQNSNKQLEKHFKGELDYYECESRMRHKDGHWVWVLDRGRVFSWTEDKKPLMMFGTHQDITHRKQTELALRKSEERLQLLAKTDGLTGLLNRSGWEECIAVEERRAQRSQLPSCVIVVDLDNLKKTNDVHGHKAGDELIRRAARCIQGAVREVDTVARIGGDEFAIVGIECGEEGARTIFGRINDALSDAGIGASSGMAMRGSNVGFDCATAEADRRMYEMKAERRKRHANRRA